MLPWVNKYENVGVTAVGKFMFPLVDYESKMPPEVKCNVFRDDALYDALVEHRRLRDAGEPTDFGAKGYPPASAAGGTLGRRGVRDRREEEEEVHRGRGMGEQKQEEKDWITELLAWMRERRRRGRDAYKEGDTRVNPDDVLAFTRKDYDALLNKAGLKRRVVNGRRVHVFAWPDGREEPAYVATRKLPLTLPENASGEL